MNLQRSDRSLTSFTMAGLLMVLVVAVMYLFNQQIGEVSTRWAIDVSDVVGSTACALLCFVLWRASEQGEDLRRVWAHLGVGLALWAVAEVIFAIYELALDLETPAVSLADIAWVIGYIPIFIALWLRFRLLKVSLRTAEWFGLLVGFAVLAGLSVAFVIAPNISSAQAEPDTSFAGIAALALSVFYPLGDLLTALGAGLTVVAMMGGSISRLWLPVALGCLAIGVGDSMYYFGLTTGLYADTGMNLFMAVCDISYLVGYVMIAVGLFAQARFQRAL